MKKKVKDLNYKKHVLFNKCFIENCFTFTRPKLELKVISYKQCKSEFRNVDREFRNFAPFKFITPIKSNN